MVLAEKNKVADLEKGRGRGGKRTESKPSRVSR